jgi:predicted small lipoprotein YifL
MKIVLLALAAVLFLSACGKKAPLRPPSPEEPPSSFVE